jgi:small Trp-rich protein
VAEPDKGLRDMGFLVIGVVLLGLKLLEIGPFANLSWVLVFTPFGLAILWWAWADKSGYSARKAMQAEQAKKQARIDKLKDDIGTLKKPSRK